MTRESDKICCHSRKVLSLAVYSGMTHLVGDSLIGYMTAQADQPLE